MVTYCICYKKNTTNENPRVRKTTQNRLTLLSNCPAYGEINWLLLKIKNSTILILFEIVSLKRIKSLPNFYWLDTSLCQNWI